MSDYKIITNEPISSSEVLDILSEKQKEKELNYREEKSLEYLKKIVKIRKKDLDKIKKEIKELNIPRLEDKHILKIIEIMPKNGTELRSIVSNSGTILVDESVSSILNTLNKFRL